MKKRPVYLFLASILAFSLTGCQKAEIPAQIEKTILAAETVPAAVESPMPEEAAIPEQTEPTPDDAPVRQEEGYLPTEEARPADAPAEDTVEEYSEEEEAPPVPSVSNVTEAEAYASGEDAQIAAADAKPPAIVKPSAHIHSYRRSIVAATCQRSGYTKHTCSCGSTYFDHFTRSRNHIYIAQKTAPTCVDGGYTEYTCKHCGYSYLDSRTAALGHIWGDWETTKEPTESESGVKTRTCSVCKKAETAVLDKLPHTHNFVVADQKDATCTEDGYILTKCSCGESKKEVLPAVGHTWVHHHEDEVSHEDVYIVCRCGWSCPADIDYSTAFADHLDSLPIEERYEGHSYHSEARKVVDTPAKDWYECTACGTQTSLDPDHQHVYTDQVVEPTCTTDGYTVHTCACGDSYKDTPTPATGHTWGDWETIQEPTETEAGVKMRTCSACGETETASIDMLPHTHNFVVADRKDATCTEDGYITKTCACGESEEEVIPAVGHSWEHHHQDKQGHYIGVMIVCRCGWSCSADIDYITAFCDHLESLPIEERYEGHSYHTEGGEFVVDVPEKDWDECSVCGIVK